MPVEAIFFAHVKTGPGGPPNPLYNGYRFFPGVKRPGHGADHPPPSRAEIKRVELYLYPLPLLDFCSVTGYLYYFSSVLF
jgi:hypothetical protein